MVVVLLLLQTKEDMCACLSRSHMMGLPDTSGVRLPGVCAATALYLCTGPKKIYPTSRSAEEPPDSCLDQTWHKHFMGTGPCITISTAPYAARTSKKPSSQQAVHRESEEFARSPVRKEVHASSEGAGVSCTNGQLPSRVVCHVASRHDKCTKTTRIAIRTSRTLPGHLRNHRH